MSAQECWQPVCQSSTSSNKKKKRKIQLRGQLSQDTAYVFIIEGLKCTSRKTGGGWSTTGNPSEKAVNQKVTKRCLPGLGYIHHYRCATGEVPYPRADIGKFSNIILL